MNNGFEQLDSWIVSAIQSMQPASRKRLLREIARDIRKSNQSRITKQVSPTGERWPARKPGQNGKIRQAAKMLIGFRAARRLRIKTSKDDVTIGFRGSTAKIAAVHQYGAFDYVEKGGPKIKYPKREILGLSVTDKAMIRRRLLDHIADRT
tara:strand:- start:1924 stop:2376 length:453 start_codon:yes stop_codon:yes gene_type:complete